MNIIDHRVRKIEAFTLGPGEYIVGDPSYFVPNDKWDEVLQSSKFFNAEDDGSALGHFTDKDGKQVAVIAFGTVYGDGEYSDEYGHLFPVDAGLIGIGLVEDFPVTSRSFNSGCHTIKFERQFIVKTMLNKNCRNLGFGDDCDTIIKFGHIEINTGDDESD